MINTKGKRKIVYMGNTYYWYIRYEDGSPKIHIVSEDKKIQFSTGFDREMILGSGDIADMIRRRIVNNP